MIGTLGSHVPSRAQDGTDNHERRKDEPDDAAGADAWRRRGAPMVVSLHGSKIWKNTGCPPADAPSR